MQKQALSLLISMLLHLFSHRMDLRCFLSGPGRARRCAVLNSYKSECRTLLRRIVILEDWMKERLDVLLVKRNLAESREKAKALIMAGIVYVDGQKEDKAGTAFEDTVSLEVREAP